MTIVNTNVAALSAQSSMIKNAKEMENAMAKLSSGHRIILLQTMLLVYLFLKEWNRK